MATFKIFKEKFIEMVKYREFINSLPFDEIDWSDFPKYKGVAEQEKKDFRFTGLANVDFARMYLLDEE